MSGVDPALPSRAKVGHNGYCVALFTSVNTVWVGSLGAVPPHSSGLSTRTCQGVNPVPGKHMSGHLLLGVPSIPFPFFCHRILTYLEDCHTPACSPCGSVGSYPLSKYSQSIVFHWLQWLVQEWIGDWRQTSETQLVGFSWKHWKIEFFIP